MEGANLQRNSHRLYRAVFRAAERFAESPGPTAAVITVKVVPAHLLYDDTDDEFRPGQGCLGHDEVQPVKNKYGRIKRFMV